MRAGLLLLLLLALACASKPPKGESAPPKAAELGAAAAAAPQAVDPAQASGAAAGSAPDAQPAAAGWLAAPASAPRFAAQLPLEAGPLQPFSFRSPDGRFSGSALAARAPAFAPLKPGHAPQLLIGFGAPRSIFCALHSGTIRPAVSLRLMLGDLEKTHALRQMAVVDVRAVAQSPLLFLDVFTAPLGAASPAVAPAGDAAPEPPPAPPSGAADAGPARAPLGSLTEAVEDLGKPATARPAADGGAPGIAGPAEQSGLAGKSGDELRELKIAFFARSSGSLICTHEGPGYRRSFERIVESIAASLADHEARKTAAPRSVVLRAVRSEGRLIGYQQERLFPPRSDGTHEELLYAPRFALADDGHLVVGDVDAIERRAAYGELRHGAYAVLQEAQVTHVVLAEEADGSYAVHGTEDDKPLASSVGSIKGAKGLRRPTPEQLAEVGSGAKAELVFDDYSPLQPLQLKLLRVRRGPAPGSLVVGSSAGEDQRWTIDAAGVLLKVEERGLDGAPESIERIWSWGAP